MSRATVRRCWGIGGLLLLSAGTFYLPSLTMAADPLPSRKLVIYGPDGTSTDTLRWSTSSGGQAVLTVEGDDEERWLVLTIDGRSTARLGGLRTHPLGDFGKEFELRDDLTGWWIRYSLTTPGFTPPPPTAGMTLDEILERVRQAREESGAETVGEIWTSDGISVELSSREGPSLYSEVAPILREKGLREGMPRTTQEAARFLVRMRERNPHMDRYWESEFDFLGLLVDALNGPKGESEASPTTGTVKGSDTG